MYALRVSQATTRRRRTPNTAYRSTEEGRELLQGRLQRFARVGFLISVVFYPIGALTRAVTGTTGVKGVQAAFGSQSTWHLIATALFLAAWLYVRRGQRSFLVLRSVDVALTVGGCLALEMMGYGVPSWLRPEIFACLIVSQILAIRASIIPGSAELATLIASAAVAPIPIVSFFYYREHPLAGNPIAPSSIAINTVVLAALVVVVTYIVSNTVHGLRERVREAMKLGQYTLTEKIGEGGMGVVYKASHALLRRPTAIKLLPPERAGEDNLTRFEREVQLTSMLTHPNTVSIYDFGRTPEGTFYYAMEYLEGLDLQSLLDADGPQPPGRVIHILAQACGALAEAHGVGLVHRDVKPANLILSERGGTADVVKVLDFGLVKQFGAGAEPGISESGVARIVGTPLYLSPEAISAPQAMDGRSDLYSLGATAYFLLTGKPPFSGDSAIEVCGHHLHTPPIPPSERLGRPLPDDLQALVLACLAKTPAERPADAPSLKSALLACEAAAHWTEERAHAWWISTGRALLHERKPKTATRHARSVLLTREAQRLDAE